MLEHREANLRKRCDQNTVHALRVAVRRTRALLWSMRPWIKRERYRVLSNQLKRMSRQLAPQRDLDVVTGIVMIELARKAGLDRAERRRLGEDLRRERVRVRRQFLAATGSVAARQRRRQVHELLASGPALFRKSVPAAGVPWHARVLRRVSAFDRGLHRARRRDLHRVRIRAKRCRYALEALGPDAPRQSLQRMKGLQASLGCSCDARLAAEWLQLKEPGLDEALRERLLRAAEALARQRAMAAVRGLR